MNCVAHRLTAVFAAVTLLAAGCSQPSWTAQGSKAGADASSGTWMPEFYGWSTPFIGKPFLKKYPKMSKCYGNLDRAFARFGGNRPGSALEGWGYDEAAQKPVDHILIVDSNALVVGSGLGGVERDDVPVYRHDIQSKVTGWIGFTSVVSGSIDAWGLTAEPGSICRLGHIDL